ncbi:MAG: hypothetical protein HRU26_11355 [Psychroserpens sp.]|nr:hypothetical protein [Psychroserpens sp.]
MEFQDNINYIQIPKVCTGKRKAFERGWKSKQSGAQKKENPYDPRIKNFIATNPYYKYWDLGFECNV